MADLLITFSSLVLLTDMPVTASRVMAGASSCMAAVLVPSCAVGVAAWRDDGQRTLPWIVALVVGTALAQPVTYLIVQRWDVFGPPRPFDLQRLAWGLLANWVQYLALGTAVLATLLWWRRDAEVADALHRARLTRARLAAQCDLATLALLRAQIEPHFLFNTLATIKQLGVHSEAGDHTLSRLIDYLHATRVHLRRDEATLGDELALARAYLEIQAIRMGPRLRFDTEVPADLLGNRIPPATLLTLVENAVKHGLSPLPAGGRIRIRAAHVAPGLVEVGVSDDGAGFSASFGRGLGLANVRERLRVLHGERGALSLAGVQPHGVVAALRLPQGRPQDLRGSP